MALHHSEGDGANLPLQVRQEGGREGREGGEEKEPQPRPAPASSAGHAQQQLGTLINLSEGGDLFVCEGPG